MILRFSVLIEERYIPIISIIIGEAGSGGAIALATADRILMLEHAIYSVISPEGCASILWRNTEYTQQAAETLKLTNSEFVAAAEIIGNSKFKIVFLHILPNAVNPIIIIATVEIANMIIFEAGLSFLGLGIKPPTPSWGTMLSDGRDYIYSFIWWPSTFAGLSIFFLVFSVNIFGDWLRDHLDPRITN